MKRMISYLLAAVLLLTPCLPAYAEEAQTGIEAVTGDSVVQQQADDMTLETAGSESPSPQDESADTGTEVPESAEISSVRGEIQSGMSQVDVKIVSALILKKQVTFEVSLTGQNAKSVVLEGTKEDTEQTGVSFENLAAGNYTLTVTAPGFAKYTQEIVVEENQAYFLKLMTGFVKGYDYENGPHPGVMLIGDVNKDNIVDEKDKTQLVDAIHAGSTDKAMDLNGDTKVNLVDLELFSKGFGKQAVQSTTAVGIPAKLVSGVNPVSSTSVEGKLESLLTNEKSTVALKPGNGAEISSDNPVSLEFAFSEDHNPITDGIILDAGKENPISDMEVFVEYVDENGVLRKEAVSVSDGVNFLLANDQVTTSQDENGVISIDFGSQIAVKKVTFQIKGMKKNASLAEISKVEFLNGMENRIPEPALDIPQNVKVDAGNKKFTLTWDPCINVTGYEVLFKLEDEENPEKNAEELIYAKGNTLNVSSIAGDKLVNNKPYTVQVRSVNGAWRSKYSSVAEVIMKADKKPAAPDYLKITGKYKAIVASWKDMEDTDTYNIYYRERGAETYEKIEGIATNSYTISNLKDKTEYQVYVTGVNELGEGPASIVSAAETTDLVPAQMPKYKIINYAEPGKVSEHIINASYNNGSMVDSDMDTEGKTAWGTVDNDPFSHFLLNSWDSGGFNPLGANGVFYEFDQPYKLQNIALEEVSEQSPSYGYVRVKYWDENGTAKELPRMGIQKKMDAENRAYYMIRLPEAITAKKIQFGVARSVASGTITFSEVYFYHYDSLEDDIMGLYEDDLHTVLRPDVTQATVDELRARINTTDVVSGEYHPDKEKLERELKTAEDILNAVQLSDSVRVHNGITTSDVGRGFGGLNAWQPLGITAAAGEEITVYVGHNTKRTGDNTNLQLVATQYHAEASSMFKVVATLKVGRNDITIPKLATFDNETGGALYVQYTGKSANDFYAVRVSGGASVPILDLYQVTDQEERLARTTAYMKELQAYVNQIETMHNEQHKGSKLASVNKYDYEAGNCILGAADILSDTMLFSIPAQQIVAGTKGDAQTLLTSIDAMEEMMYLFYQHKGLNNSAAEAKDRIPVQHQNIRYQRMFAGAFMYASGNHVGIEWGSTPGMVNCKSLQADEEGKYVSGNYFGWGIGHEIGHCINQGSYAVAETTNNYFAVLAQAQDNNNSVRFKYENIYDKVTSNTKGPAPNVFTQLGMYWQLHLAYDEGYNFKTYENYDEQLANLFFARVDTYSRTPSKAPQAAENGVPLTLTGGTDQALMRLSCAAAQKNLLEFFERWGKTPDADTIAYAEQFEKETRAIYYANDDSRVYRKVNAAAGSSLGTSGTVEAVGPSTTATVNENEANRVDFTLESDNKDLFGFEIVRCTISGGEVEKQVVGFTTGTTFSDYVTTMNNRVVTYEITVIDHYLNRSAVKTLAPLKIEHKGNIDKTNWTVSTTDLTATSKVEADENEDKEDTCGPKEEAPITSAVDNDVNTVYTGSAGTNAEIVMEFNQYQTITGFEYRVSQGTAIEDYSISVREADGSWTEVSTGTLGNSKTVYFGKKGNVAAYTTDAVKLAIKNQSGKEIAISELDVLGITGDNVELDQTLNDAPSIGTLKSDYRYGTGETDVIPAGSIIFTGSYKGNPAYNVVMLYDQDGNVVTSNGEASHIILADVPNTGNIQDVNAGSWIYWIDPKGADLTKIQKVRAELYRVDDALTNEGERMVSDSLFVEMPGTLPEIVLTQSGN
ncbi:MAG: PEGA domain-containing protein [Lachnospiraceae bacterium]|nr:PEGA domain-containing protein [Lachnospiraceae bacterium]